MTDLQILSEIKSKPFATNCFMLENEVIDNKGFCFFENQREEGVFCFYKNSQFNFKNMFFYANNTALLAKNPILWKEPYFITEVVAIENNVEQNLQIKNWLISQGNYHYHTVFRMYLINKEYVTNEKFSLVQNPDENDFEDLLLLLEQNFNKYTERIPTLERLKELQKSTYIIKEGNEIAAIFLNEIKGTTKELLFWLVVSKFRGKGYGELIFDYCLNCNPEIKRYLSWIDVNHKYSIKKHIDYGFVKDRITNSIYLNNNIMKEEILNILEETRPEFDFKDETINFITAGYLDSFDLISLVDDLENKFEVKIIGSLIVPESFESVAAILKLIETSKNAS